MKLKGEAKFKGKLTCGLKNDKSLKIWILMGSFCPKQSFRWKRTEELCLMTLKSDARFEEKPIFGSKNNLRNLVNFNASSGKSENLHFDVLLLLKVYYVRTIKVQRKYLS